MRDVDARDALRAKGIEDLEQVVGLGLRQGGGRLVQDQDPRFLGQRLGDLHQLLRSDAEIDDPRGRAELEAHFLEGLRRPLERLVPVDDALPLAQLAAEEDVLGDRHLLHQRQLLVDDGDAGVLAVADAVELLHLPVQDDVAGVRAVRIEAAEDLHQRRFSCAVLADQRVDLSLADLERHVLERADARELLGDVPHLQQVLAHGVPLHPAGASRRGGLLPLTSYRPATSSSSRS